MEVTMAKYQSGLAAIFTTEEGLLKAAKKMRQIGLKDFEAISPYPIHGMEEVCGIKRSWIPYVAFVAGVSGMSFGTWFPWFTSAVDWPIVVGGKPFWSLPAFIPITFELTILFSALASVAAMILACGLPKIDPPVIDPDLTSHKFAIFIPKGKNAVSEVEVRKALEALGPEQIKETEF
jgi:hypothetical protein